MAPHRDPRAPEPPSSRIPGFYKLDTEARLQKVQAFAGLSDAQVATLRGGDPDRLAMADRMIENVAGLFHLPVGFAANFRIDARDVLVPMVIEEPSVVAASSNAAKLLRGGPGIRTSATAPLMIGQIQLLDVPDLERAVAAITEERDRLVALANEGQPRLVARGGGCRRLSVRPFDAETVSASAAGPTELRGPMLVVHLLVDVCDAMGANLVNAMAEALAGELEALSGGRAVLRILSNLADERLAMAEGRVPVALLARPDMGMDGHEVASRIESASVFAEVDPYRAATHNKGIMNGVDAFLLAVGQDWRAMEAGAHAYAARDGRYTAIATWRHEGDELVGRITLPVQVGTVGGVTKVHPTVKVLLEVLGASSASEVGQVAASVGLAQNLAAIMALATEGIQRGHMSLHARNIAAAVGAEGKEIDRVVAEMIRRRAFTHAAAESIVKEREAARDQGASAGESGAARHGAADAAPEWLTFEELTRMRDRVWPRIEAEVAAVFPRDAPAGSLADMVWYQLGTGGKRLRAVLPLMVYEAFGGVAEDAVGLAAALELLHNATLVHDDAEGAVRTRRGHDTIWVRYGLNQAINCGDGLHYGALRCLSQVPRAAGVVGRLQTMTVEHMQTVVQAQVDALRLQRTGGARAAGRDRLDLARDRTGGLFALAVAGGAVLAEADDAIVARLDRVGGHLGVIFRLQDELLDWVGGKPSGKRGTELADGKVGILTDHALTHGGEADVEALRGILLKPQAATTGADVERAYRALADSGSLRWGADLIKEHQSAIDALATSLAQPALARLLAGMTDVFLAPVLATLEGAVGAAGASR